MGVTDFVRTASFLGRLGRYNQVFDSNRRNYSPETQKRFLDDNVLDVGNRIKSRYGVTVLLIFPPPRESSAISEISRVRRELLKHELVKGRVIPNPIQRLHITLLTGRVFGVLDRPLTQEELIEREQRFKGMGWQNYRISEIYLHGLSLSPTMRIWAQGLPREEEVDFTNNPVFSMSLLTYKRPISSSEAEALFRFLEDFRDLPFGREENAFKALVYYNDVFLKNYRIIERA